MLSTEEFKQRLNEVLENVNDPGKVSNILTSLHEDYNATVTEYQSITEHNTKLKESNASLVEANGKLFRSVGLVKEEAEKEMASEEPAEEEKPNLPSIDDVMENLLPTWGVK